MTNPPENKAHWDLTKGKLKQKWPALTDEDLYCDGGGHELLLGRIQRRTGETREAVENALKECSGGNACTTVTPEATAHWDLTKGKLKQKWGALTEADLQFAVGGREALLDRIQQRTGETRAMVDQVVRDCSGPAGCCIAPP